MRWGSTVKVVGKRPVRETAPAVTPQEARARAVVLQAQMSGD
jgi:hypothetical protein